MFSFLGNLFGGSRSAAIAESTPLAPVGPVPQRPIPFRDQIWSDVWPQPYRGPLDLDRYGGETSEMRLAFRELYRRESFIKASIEGKAAAVAGLDLVVIPCDKDREEDRKAAEFVKWSIEDSRDGSDGLIRSMLVGGFVDGWSLGNLKLKIADGHGRWRGLAGLDHVRWLDTAYMRLQLDQFRNLVGVVNTIRGLEDYDPSTCVLFTHNELFTNPFGQADMRSVYRDANILEDAMYLWHTGARVFGLPVLYGKVDAKTGSARFQQMYDALQDARAAGVIVSPKEDDVAILNIAAATSLEAFKDLVTTSRESIVTGIRGAYLPFMQGQGSGDTRGSSNVGKHAGSDPGEFLLAKAVGRVLMRQVAPHLVRPNFPTAGIPRILLGGVNWAETKSQLDVIQEAKSLGLKISAKHVHEITQIPPPDDPEDELRGPDDQPPPGSPPEPGPGGIPAIAPAATGTTPVPTPTAPAPEAGSTPPADQFAATSATPFQPTDAARYAEFFLPTKHGHFPGDMHEQFGLDVAKFAAATKLFRKAVRRGGQTGWVWAAKPTPATAVETPPVTPPTATFSALPLQTVSAVEPLGPVVQVPTARLLADPVRFQFRRGHDSEDGTVRDLPAEKFDPKKCPPLAAWRDPADGGEYVVDGHHRLAWAERDGVTRVPARWIIAKTADEAKAIGERLNREQPAPAPIPTPVAERVPLPKVDEDDFDMLSAGLFAATFSDGGSTVFASDRKSPANGRYKDSLGRARCYRDGKQVPCGEHPDTEHEIAKHVESAREHLSKTTPVTHADVKTMAEHLEKMTVPELKKFQREFLDSARGKQAKAERVKALLDWSKENRANLDMDFDTDETIKREKKDRDPNKDPIKERLDKVLPVKEEPKVDYQQKNPDHPVAKAIREDTQSRDLMLGFLDKIKPLAEAADVDAAHRKLGEARDHAQSLWSKRVTMPATATRSEKIQATKEWKTAEKEADRLKGEVAIAYNQRTELAAKARQVFADHMKASHGGHRDALSMGVQLDYGAEGVKPIEGPDLEQATKVRDWVGSVTSEKSGSLKPFTVAEDTTGRAYYADNGFTKKYTRASNHPLVTTNRTAGTINEATLAHEIGHHIEVTKPGVLQAAVDFVTYRTEGEQLVKLKDRFPANGFDDNEQGAADDFGRVFPGSSAYYVGKSYGGLNTEVVSMGLEQIYRDPVEFAKKDPEYFQFMISVLR
jgi:hypothetical protein